VRRAAHLLIAGRVQGVGYRAWAAETARRLALDGWVRNRADGSVELVVAGEAGLVTAMITACRTGPSLATVSDIAESSAPGDPGVGFRILPTA
jgi:acylphosphatase